MRNIFLRIGVPPRDRKSPLFFHYNYLIAKVGGVKEKLFASNQQGDDGPSEEDDQKDNKLFD